jgi:hypothetical protein
MIQYLNHGQERMTRIYRLIIGVAMLAMVVTSVESVLRVDEKRHQLISR